MPRRLLVIAQFQIEITPSQWQVVGYQAGAKAGFPGVGVEEIVYRGGELKIIFDLSASQRDVHQGPHMLARHHAEDIAIEMHSAALPLRLWKGISNMK